MSYCRSRLVRLSLAALALLVGAGPGAAQGRPYLSSTPAADPACSGYQWVGVKKNRFAACPSVGAWKGRALFGELYRSSGFSCTERSRAEAAGLDRFCVYRAPYDAAAFDPSQLEPPAKLRSRLAKLDKDCVALQAQGDNLQDLLWKPLQEEFLRQAGELPVAMPVAKPVRLAVLDTQPTGQGAPKKPGLSGHGHALAHMARGLACPDAGQPCGLRLATRLALPVVAFEKRGETFEPILGGAHEGGYYGRITDVALAIAEEVHAANGAEVAMPLVLNLSLGWDGSLFGGEESDPSAMPTAVAAAWAALDFAQRSRALVIAAAGNRLGGVGSSCGALFPAAWERRGPAVPSARVYSVGAVQANGQPLANSRLCAQPGRQAYGDHAVVAAHDGMPTVGLTGSSVASLVVAVAAGSAWHQQPTLTPTQVMALVEASGDELVATRRISVCNAQRHASGSSPACPQWPFQPLDLGEQLAHFVADHSARVERVATERLGLPGCGGESCAASALDRSLPVPVRPQPEEDPCLNCGLTGGGRPPRATVFAANEMAFGSSLESEVCLLRAQLRPAWFARQPLGTCLEAPRLVVERGVGSVVERSTYWLADGPAFCGEPFPDSFDFDLGVPCSSFTGAVVRLELDAVEPGGQRKTVEGTVFVSP